MILLHVFAIMVGDQLAAPNGGYLRARVSA
jgi:hypothetical protein